LRKKFLRPDSGYLRVSEKSAAHFLRAPTAFQEPFLHYQSLKDCANLARRIRSMFSS